MIDPAWLGWPESHELDPDYGLCGNHEFSDMSGKDWSDVQSIIEQEEELLARLSVSTDTAQTEGEIMDELYEDFEWCGLDIGVASAVFALSALGALPVASCNGGIYGRHHHESNPLVVAFIKREHIEIIDKAVSAARIRVEHHRGAIIFHGDGPRDLFAFGGCIYELATSK